MSNPKSAGRKPKYTDEHLIKIVESYVENHPFEKIKISRVAKEAEIPYHILRDNKAIQSLIKALNSTETLPQKTNVTFELPSAEDIVSKHYSNKKRLTQNVQALLDLVCQYHGDSTKVMELSHKEKEYQDKILELEAENRRLMAEIDKLNHEIDLLYIDSESATKRREQGIVKNMIAIDRNDLKPLSKNIDDIEEVYSGLFDD